MNRVCIYLRKSRADIEAEARGEGETLAKHKKALLKLANQQGMNILMIREEIVSGESLLYRPEMQELLKEVQEGKYEAVLVMDMDRLGRGNMQEQGLILETFRASNTKIITPRKIYDLNNEFDEEYSEFEAFMARKELKIITRRLQGGRVRSVEEGNYIGTRPPYGYEIFKNDRERFLVPHPEQAIVVKMIFELYAHEDPSKRLGTNKIAAHLNQLGYQTYTGRKWVSSSVLNILKNAVYIGRVQWKKKEYKKSTDPTKVRDTKTRPKDEWIDAKGKHEPLVSDELFERAQEFLKDKYHVPFQLVNGISNPLAGLIKCGMCGQSMVLRPYTKQQPHLICYNQLCKNKSSRFSYVEEKLINGIKRYLEKLKDEMSTRKPSNDDLAISIEIRQNAIRSLTKELHELEIQKSKLHDFLERGIYTEEIFLERSKNLMDRIESVKTSIRTSEDAIITARDVELEEQIAIPRLEGALDSYFKSDDPLERNLLLKSVVEQAIYRKEKYEKDDNFELIIITRIKQKQGKTLTDNL